MLNVIKVKLLSERTSGVPPVIFVIIIIRGGASTMDKFVEQMSRLWSPSIIMVIVIIINVIIITIIIIIAIIIIIITIVLRTFAQSLLSFISSISESLRQVRCQVQEVS